MRRALALVLALAGAALLVGLFFVLRPAADEEPPPAAPPTATEQPPTVEAEEAEEPEEPEEPVEPEPAPTETAPEVATLRVMVREGRPEGGIQRLTVRQGERVRVVVRADVSDHVHVHGYDLLANVGPGRPAQISFQADVPGRFEIELEDRGLHVAELEVTP